MLRYEVTEFKYIVRTNCEGQPCKEENITQGQHGRVKEEQDPQEKKDDSLRVSFYFVVDSTIQVRIGENAFQIMGNFGA